MATNGKFRTFRAGNGIALVLEHDKRSRRVHILRKGNSALYDYLDDLLGDN